MTKCGPARPRQGLRSLQVKRLSCPTGRSKSLQNEALDRLFQHELHFTNSQYPRHPRLSPCLPKDGWVHDLPVLRRRGNLCRGCSSLVLPPPVRKKTSGASARGLREGISRGDDSWSSQRVHLVDTSSGCDVRTGVGGSPRATGRAKQQARKQTVTNVNRNTLLLSRVAQRALRLMEVLAPSRRQTDENVLSIFHTRTLDSSLVLDVAR
ncbi:hypothetical protein C0Q70_17969 [Pomacea canaliculata]|uniref:Uncharacterized protein n=1 Tax=Pomacea canaliculata TaxID=400727 RepID=A0A2T7NLX1_POMCA|nr:hypothetical protein C0Q70_17969 [Pomacea canaliculata]